MLRDKTREYLLTCERAENSVIEINMTTVQVQQNDKRLENTHSFQQRSEMKKSHLLIYRTLGT